MNRDPFFIIETFCEKYLDGDINRIVGFDLSNLEGDKICGCPGRNFDCDDTNVARAVFSVVLRMPSPTSIWKPLGRSFIAATQ